MDAKQLEDLINDMLDRRARKDPEIKISGREKIYTKPRPKQFARLRRTKRKPSKWNNFVKSEMPKLKTGTFAQKMKIISAKYKGV